MKSFGQKLIITIISVSIALNPLFALIPEKVRAAEPEEVDTSGSSGDTSIVAPTIINIANQKTYSYQTLASGLSGTCAAVKRGQGSAYNDLLAIYKKYTPSKDNGLTFDDIFTPPTSPKIVLTAKDQTAVRSLSCLSDVMPNYAQDYTALYKAISGSRKNEITQSIGSEASNTTPRFTTKEQYFDFLKYGSSSQDPVQHLSNVDYFNTLVKEAESSFTNDQLNQIWSQEETKIANGQVSSIPVSTLMCVTGLTENQLRAKLGTGDGGAYISNVISQALNSLTLDIRVINTLVYLVTPKDQGGAGHWRIRAARILQGGEQSVESDAANIANQKTATPTLTSASANGNGAVNCDASMTAAECGSQQNQGNAIVDNADGTSYTAFFQNMDSEMNNNRNVSAHFTGQAVDISEVDDIRCTLVSMHHVGKDTKKAQPIKPLKLAWQTTDGFNKSGGSSNFDQMSLMKDLAKQSIIDLLSSMNENITDYSGDLTKANFADLIGILGQSLLTQVVSTPGQSLSGYDVMSTLKSLGTTYLADYFSLPREIFQNADIHDLDSIKYVIGRSAIEKKLGLPYASLDDLNIIATNKDISKPVYNLEGLLFNVGQRKIEYEMGLESHDLDRVFKNTADGSYLLDNTALGRIVIEDDLHLPKGSWPQTAVGFGNLKDYISSARANILRIDPGSIDSTLHLDPGVTKTLISGTITTEQYANKVGTSRYNNTTAGLKYFQLNNSAYALPGPSAANPNAFDTWKEALRGNPEALKTVGIYTMARLLGENSLDINTFLPDNFKNANITKLVVSAKTSTFGGEQNITYDRAQFGQFIFREWLRSSLGGDRVTSADSCAKPKNATNLSVTYSGQAVYNGPVNLSAPTSTDIQNTVNNSCVLYQPITVNSIDYSDASGSHTQDYPISVDINISEANALGAGLGHFDLNSIMGYQQADGRSVFNRIGANMLYYAIANKALNPTEKAKIELQNTNPTLRVNDTSGSAAFYVSRVLKMQSLVKQIQTNWNNVSVIDRDKKDITDKINKSFDDLRSIYKDSDFDLTKVSKIASTITTISRALFDIKNNLETLQARYSYVEINGTNGTEVRNKISQINAIVFDVNNLILTAAEIMQGHTINSSDSISIPQMSQGAGIGSSSGDNGTKGLSDWEIMLDVFALISGKMSPEELMLKLGANSAETSLGLPRNSLLYLAQNYEKNGITGIDAFWQSLGQAQIEQALTLPTNYFQGNEIINKIPKFGATDDQGGYKNLLQWANDGSGKSLIRLDAQLFFGASGNYTDDTLLYMYIPSVRTISPKKFDNWVKTAKKRWLEQNKTYQTFDKTIQNVVQNISDRGFAGGINSAQNDLLMRMGFPTGIYDGLVSNSPVAWQMGNSRALAIDQKLNLPDGYTKMLFTGNTALTSKSISNDEKNMLQASSLNLSTNEIEKYIQMINGSLLPSENNEYQNAALTDYIVANPYADPGVIGSTCPVLFTQKDGFRVNEQTITADTFCYYDKKGRHCFQSKDEAERFAAAHTGDKISDILDDMASKISVAIDKTDLDVYGHSTEDIKANLKDFINDKTKPAAFSDDVLNALSEAVGADTATTTTVHLRAGRETEVADSPAVSRDTLDTLFTRKQVDAPLASYKAKAGIAVSERILTTEIFRNLNLQLDPTFFDGADLWNILNGNYSSLTRMGTMLVDRAMDMPSGTTMLIYTATTQGGIKCALAQAGGSILGRALGLQYFPADRLLDPANFVSAIGEEKIEETLGLPRNSFRVDDSSTNNTLDNLIKNVGIINFAVAFKLPIDLTKPADKTSFDTAMAKLFGSKPANLSPNTQSQPIGYSSVQNTSPQYQLQKARDLLKTSLVMTVDANQGRIDLENLLKTLLNADDGALKSLKTNVSLTRAAPAGADDGIRNIYANYNLQVKDFYDQTTFLDTTLGINRSSTTNMLGGNKSPAAYINDAGKALGTRIGGMKIAEMLGLDQSEAQAAVDLGINLQNIFFCGNGMSEYTDQNGNTGCGSFQGIGQNVNPWNGVSLVTTLGSKNHYNGYYHNWGYLYDNLDKVFHFKLDAQAGLPAGTISQVINNPNNTFQIFIGIGATKLDAQYKLNSASVKSFSGLYRTLFPAQITSFENVCRAQVWPNGEDADRDRLMAADQEKLKSNPGDPATLADIKRLRDQYQTDTTNYSNCLEEARYAYNMSSSNPDNPNPLSDPSVVMIYLGRTWEWIQAAAAQEIHDQLINITVNVPGCTPGHGISCVVNVGIDMPVSDIRHMFEGDLRYAGAAAAAMSANIVMIGIDSITTNNCNPREQNADGCRAPVPASMRISYDELKTAFFGLPADQVQKIAAWNEATDGAYKPNPDHTGIGSQGCPMGTVSEGFECVAQAGVVKNPNLDVQNQVGRNFGYSEANRQAEIKKMQQAMDDNRKMCSDEGKTGQDLEDCTTNYNLEYQYRLDLLNHPEKVSLKDNPYATEVQASAQGAAMNKLKYDMMDIALWKLDDNIYSGFSQAMMNGNTGERWAALAHYMRNGLVNGHLFGIKFSGVDAGLVDAGAAFLALITATNDADRTRALNNITGTEFNTVVNFISSHSEKWLGFKLDPEITGGLVTSIATNHWGADAFSLDGTLGGNAGPNTNTTKFAGSDRPTLGGAVVNFGLTKIFAWADKELGLKPGQTLQIFSAARDSYKAYIALQTAKANLGTATTKLATDTKLGASPETLRADSASVKANADNVTKADAKFTAAVSAGVQLVVGILVDKLLGKVIGEWESQLDLPAGTLEGIISSAVYEGIAAAVNYVAGYTVLSALGPAGWGTVLAMALINALFGVYRVEYWCDADGYFPKMGTANPTKNDISGVGEWGGKVGWKNLNQIIQNGTIAAAQAKASALIGNVLSMQYNGKYNDADGLPTVPTQIMTGRSEDVEFWKDAVTHNICETRLGNEAQVIFDGTIAVCDAGTQRMGLWQNPQTVAWTHIGF